MKLLAWLGAVQAALLLSERSRDAQREASSRRAREPNPIAAYVAEEAAKVGREGDKAFELELLDELELAAPRDFGEGESGQAAPCLGTGPRQIAPPPQQLDWKGAARTRWALETALHVPQGLEDVVRAVPGLVQACAPANSSNATASSSDAARLLIARGHALLRVDVRVGDKADGAFAVTCRRRACQVVGGGLGGARYGLDFVLQAYLSGGPEELRVEDWPDRPWRGLLLDAGRRFVPPAGVKQVLDGMAIARLNVLHLHLSDYCRFALKLKDFPELDGAAQTSGAPSPGAYSEEDIHEIVAYARQRGVRVVPEVDFPGHVQGLRPLESRGLQFCDARQSDATSEEEAEGKRFVVKYPEDAAQLQDDDTGQTRQVLGQLLASVARLFPDPVFHLGQDEAGELDDCASKQPLQTWALALLRKLGKRPMAFEELSSRGPGGGLPQGAKDDAAPVILQTWDAMTPQEVAEQAYVADMDVDVVASPHAHAYLDYAYSRSPAASFYFPLGRPAKGPLGRGVPDVSAKQDDDGVPHRAPVVFAAGKLEGPVPFGGGRLRLLPSPGGARGLFLALDGLDNLLAPRGEFEVDGNTLRLHLASRLRAQPRKVVEFVTNTSGRTWAADGLPVLSRLDQASPLAAPSEPASSHRARLLGGEVAMWMDAYTDTWQCGAWGGTEVPRAAALWDRSQDAAFVESMQGMVWPRAGVFASALWNFDPLLDPSALADRQATMLLARGVAACPPGCTCSTTAPPACDSD